MNKIEVLLNDFKDYGDWSPSNWNQFTNEDMIEFAKEYAEVCMRELCSELQLYGDLHEDFAKNALIHKILRR